MKLFKNLFVVLAVVVAISAFTACTTTNPGYEHNAFPADGSKYEVLGRVVAHFDEGEAAYYKLVEEAQKQFPGADDVVNIMVDIEDQKNYIMSGIAIQYKK